MPKRKPSDVAGAVGAWLGKAKPRHSRRCTTCTHHPDAVEALRVFIAHRREHGSKLSFAQFAAEVLQPEFGYDVRYLTMMRHVRECEGYRDAGG